MEESSPLSGHICSVSQEIPGMLSNLKSVNTFTRMFRKSIQNQMNPVGTHPVSRSILIFPPAYITVF